MHFSKSLQESKSVLTMRPVSKELTLLLFLLIKHFLGKKQKKEAKIKICSIMAQ